MHAEPSLILTNARILTMDPARPRASAIAILGEKILALGARAVIEALAGPGTEVIDCHGATVLPGFVESHLHLGLGGAELTQLHLTGVTGFEAVRTAVRAYAARNPGLAILFAQGVGYDAFGQPATRPMLDQIIADRPLALMSPDHHTVWANSAALTAADLLGGAILPSGHEVVMAQDGTATGELREFEAFGPIMALGGDTRLNLGIATGAEPAPWPTEAEMAIDRAKFAQGLAHCARHGITSAVNMDGNHYTLDLLRDLQKRGGLTARVKVPLHFKPHMDLDALDRAEAMRADFSDDWLCSGFVKLFMDGVVDSRTAFMLNDYPGHPGHRSEALFPPARFNQIATEIDRRGLQIAVHAIGDGAVRMTIDGYEAAQKANGVRDSRHRIEHIEVIDPADVPRLGLLGIVASVQPVHAPGAMDFPLDGAAQLIGLTRMKDAYLARTLAEAGAPLVFASDWPVTDISVLRGVQTALTRRPFENVGCVDQRVGLEQTLHAYTAGGAWAAHWQDLTGTLRAGMAADITVLSGDIEVLAPAEIAGLSVKVTVAGGRITWRG